MQLGANIEVAGSWRNFWCTCRFKGVGPKTVACVMMFCLARDEFPVDTHVWRISKNMGWVPAKANREDTYSHMNIRVPADLRCHPNLPDILQPQSSSSDEDPHHANMYAACPAASSLRAWARKFKEQCCVEDLLPCNNAHVMQVRPACPACGAREALCPVRQKWQAAERVAWRLSPGQPTGQRPCQGLA